MTSAADAPSGPTFPVPGADTFTLTAPSSWTAVDFLSDLHLQASLPRTFEAFAGHLLHTPAEAVVILGDLFEVWVGDDAAVSGFEARCAGVLAEAAMRRSLWFMPGNRDFLVGPAFLQRCGLSALPDPSVLQAFGRRVLLSHGDALCLGDHAYQGFRRQVRTPAWQQAFLAKPLDERRAIAASLRSHSEGRKRELGPHAYADADEVESGRWLQATRAEALIHGHTHRPCDHRLPDGQMRHVLSDWDLDHAADGHPLRAQVLRLDAQGLHRVDLPVTAI